MSGSKTCVGLTVHRAILNSIPAIALVGLMTTATMAQQATEPTQPAQTQTQAPISEPAPVAPATPVQSSPQAQTPAQGEQAQPATPPAPPPPAFVAPAVEPQAPAAEQTQAQEAAPAPAPVATDIEPLDVPASTLPHDLSPWGMYMAADWVVKGVMIGLILASLLTWTIWLAKTFEISGAKLRIGKVLRVVEDARSLEAATSALAKSRGTGAIMLKATNEEVDLSRGALSRSGADGLKERVTSRLSRIEAFSGRKMTRGTGILATIGSVAPFVGLFGTVWGIMNSFISISEAQTTNLAVVAPGIAEALLATAIGLVAAIPAVIFYNVFARSIAGYRHTLGDVSAGIERLVSRDLDYGAYDSNQRDHRVSMAAE